MFAIQRIGPFFKAINFRLKIAFPAIAFFGGFLWDAFTLGRSVTSFDLIFLLSYLVAAAILLVIMGRRGNRHGPVASPEAGLGNRQDFTGDGNAAQPEPLPRAGVTDHFKSFLDWIKGEGLAFTLQFCYGSLFSALVIFYFLSSSYLPGIFVVIGLVVLLCLNEFLEGQYHRFTLTWTLFGINAILFLNFALPHVLHSIHPIWFYLSTALGVTSVYFLKKISPKAQGSLWPTYLVAGILVLLYMGNAIPPVPLVKKEMVICRGLEKQGQSYSAKIEKPNPLKFWRRSESRVRQLPGEKIYCFTSVFLPQGIAFTLYHRWMFHDPKAGHWVSVSRIGFPVRGGRKDGFRGFTFKQSFRPGKWQVRVETESGRVLGTSHFRVEAALDSSFVYKNLNLD
jgi:Protein of unknown function (DUF2914)